MTLSLPRALSNYSEAAKAGMVSLTWANSPHVQMRRDLAQAGLLTEKYAQNPLWLGSPREMGGLKGAAFADGHFDTYARLVQESLTLKPFSGQIEANGDLCRFRFPLAPSGVVVIVVEG
ncbi:MAG: hypothetical protein FJ278_23915 [Planctomycetes bacterium]|nr:hypothetical protein [Planctomycetota bacterium]